MNYTYSILTLNEAEHWITLKSSDSDYDREEPDSFMALLNKIKDDVNGKIEIVGSMQYSIQDDGLQLLYQWDSFFGITIVYPDNVTSTETIEFLNKYFI